MALEIERKFLVDGDFEADVEASTRIEQGYLSSVPERTVRVRLAGTRAFLTIKGLGNDSGASRFEWEHEIPIREAQDLLKLCEPGAIDKTRHQVNYGKHLFEIDQFHGENAGLVVAEVELQSEDEEFDKPHWLGEEVTGESRYYNSALARNPFNTW